MAEQVFGYNIGLQIGGKTIIGRTQDDLSISATTKESITKDDMGAKNFAVSGHDVSFSVSALLEVGETSTSKLDRDAIIELALKTGSDAVLDFTYACVGGKTMTGKCIISSYSETSSADPETESTISINCQATGAVTFTTNKERI